MSSLGDQSTLPRNTDSRKGVIASDHSTGEMGLTKSLNGGRRTWLQLVLKDDQSEEAKTRLRLLSERWGELVVNSQIQAN